MNKRSATTTSSLISVAAISAAAWARTQEGFLGTISEEAKAIITLVRDRMPLGAAVRLSSGGTHQNAHAPQSVRGIGCRVAAASPASALLVPRSACVEGLHRGTRANVC